MDGEFATSNQMGQDWSLRRSNRAHVCRIYELCGRDIERAANLLELTEHEVSRWMEPCDDDVMSMGQESHAR